MTPLHAFDPRAALLARHAQHVVLIHFPIALFLLGAGLDAAAQCTADGARRQALAAAAYYDLVAAAVSTLPALATGLLAWRFQLGGQALKGVLLLHLALGLAASATIWLAWWLHFRARRAPAAALSGWRLPVELAGAALVAVTGHLGGFLSGVNLPG